ncbi:hypothetical protein IWZ03DRAFT_441745 [Phyllosticta citriasiana]|uniref:Uncharacterized protein n=1 Tax=Phyllosticta citriasiana TaxID=595635 RepID=A0ABR1KLB6_9PEZI
MHRCRRWALVPFWTQVEATVAIMVACTPMLCPLFKRCAIAFGIIALMTPTHSRPRSLIEAEEGRHRRTSGSLAGRSAQSHKKRIKISSISSKSLPLPSVHLNIHLPRPRPHLGLGQQSRPTRPGPPPHIFSSHQLPQNSLFQRLEPRSASTCPRPRPPAPRRDSLSYTMLPAGTKTFRSLSLFESPTQEFPDCAIFPFGIPQSAPDPTTTEAATAPESVTAYDFAATTPVTGVLTPPVEVSDSTPESVPTQGDTASSRCPSAKFSNVVRSRSKTKSHRHLAEGEVGAGGDDEEKQVRGEWRDEMDRERTATNARARRVMGESGSNDAGGGMQWMDDWFGGLLGWRQSVSKSSSSNDSGEPRKTADARDDVSVNDYAMLCDKWKVGGAGDPVSPFKLARRFSMTSAGNSGGSGLRSCNSKEKDGRRSKTFNGRLSPPTDELRPSSITATTTTTTGTTASSSSPSSDSTTKALSPSAPARKPAKQDQRHRKRADFNLDLGDTLHSSASAPQSPLSPPAQTQDTARLRRRSDNENSSKMAPGYFRDAHPRSFPFLGALNSPPLASPELDPISNTPVATARGLTWWGSAGSSGIMKTVGWSVRRGSEASSANIFMRHQDSTHTGGSDWERGAGGGGRGGSNAASAISPSGEDVDLVGGRGSAGGSHSSSCGNIGAVDNAAASPATAMASRWSLGWMNRDRTRRGGGLTDSLG